VQAHGRIVQMPAQKARPGRYFVDHPAVYGLSLTGAGGIAGYAAFRACRHAEVRAFRWIGLAVLQVAITVGIVSVGRRARHDQ
jgi:hypothetical protein